MSRGVRQQQLVPAFNTWLLNTQLSLDDILLELKHSPPAATRG